MTSKSKLGLLLIIMSMISVPLLQFSSSLFNCPQSYSLPSESGHIHYYAFFCEVVHTSAPKAYIIVTAGFNVVRQQVGKSGSQPAAFNYIALGTGTTAVNVADTTCEGEIVAAGEARTTGTYSEPTTAQYQVTHTFSIDGSYTLGKSCVFNASSGVTMLAEQLISPTVAVISGDQYTATWQFTFTQG